MEALELEAIGTLGQWYERYAPLARDLKSLAPVFDLLEQVGIGRAFVKPGQYIIYALKDPMDHRVRYVGMTCHPSRRAAEHQRERGNFHKEAWIQRLALHHRRPVMLELERTETVVRAREREQRWIDAFLALGYPLYNQMEVR